MHYQRTELMLLIKFKANYADEFDVYGFEVMTLKEWSGFKEAVKQVFESRDEVEIYFGTNEAIEFTSYDNVMSSFKVTEIDNYEARTFQKHFQGDFGWIPIGHFLDMAGEDIE